MVLLARLPPCSPARLAGLGPLPSLERELETTERAESRQLLRLPPNRSGETACGAAEWRGEDRDWRGEEQCERGERRAAAAGTGNARCARLAVAPACSLADAPICSPRGTAGAERKDWGREHGGRAASGIAHRCVYRSASASPLVPSAPITCRHARARAQPLHALHCVHASRHRYASVARRHLPDIHACWRAQTSTHLGTEEGKPGIEGGSLGTLVAIIHESTERRARARRVTGTRPATCPVSACAHRCPALEMRSLPRGTSVQPGAFSQAREPAERLGATGAGRACVRRPLGQQRPHPSPSPPCAQPLGPRCPELPCRHTRA